MICSVNWGSNNAATCQGYIVSCHAHSYPGPAMHIG